MGQLLEPGVGQRRSLLHGVQSPIPGRVPPAAGDLRARTPNPDASAADTVCAVDWSVWAERLERALGADGEFTSFFAPGALFSDPVNAPTTDLAAIEAMTQAMFPDWRQEITSVQGDDRAGSFEWIGRGTLGGTDPIVIHGCTVVDVDGEGLVTRWRDYFDLKEIDGQLPGPAEA